MRPTSANSLFQAWLVLERWRVLGRTNLFGSALKLMSFRLIQQVLSEQPAGFTRANDGTRFFMSASAIRAKYPELSDWHRTT